MAILKRSGFGTALLALVACGTESQPAVSFERVDDADPIRVAVLRSDTTRTPRGYRVAEVHVLLPANTTESAARASLKAVIDSVAAADTLAAAVRVVGFMIGRFDPANNTAELEPAMSAFWEPTDSVGMTGSSRRARFRTNYRVLRAFPAGAGGT